MSKAMEIRGGTAFCRFCGLECVKARSRSSANPNREYYCCPTPMVNGGHGWVDWVEYERSPRKLLKENTDVGQYSNDQMSLLGARFSILEDALKLERGKVMMLEDELKEARWNTRCLTKVLKGNVVVAIFFFLFFLVN